MIEATGLTKRYGSTKAVDDLTFTVADGRVTGFLGPNGAGKSTTMRLIVGLDAPSAGRVTVGGRPYRERHFPLREVGALLEAKAIHPSRSARNHLRWLAQSNGIQPGRVDEVLDQVGLTSVAGKRAGSFSLGMSQRLGIAAALLGDPQVLLLDEPVNGLDPEGIQWVRGLLRSLASEGRTVFVSSHLMSEMALTAEHLIVIGKGRLIADASVAEVIARASSNHVKVVSPQADALRSRIAAAGADAEPAGDDTLIVTRMECRDVGILAAGAGITLYELSPQEASLEEAFMEMTRDSGEFLGSEARRERRVSTAEPVLASSAPAASPSPSATRQFGAVARAEWTKLWSVRSTLWSLLVTVAIIIGLGALFCAARVARANRLGGHPFFDATFFSLSGIFLAQLAVGVLGVLVMSSEYTTGQIPRRSARRHSAMSCSSRRSSCSWRSCSWSVSSRVSRRSSWARAS